MSGREPESGQVPEPDPPPPLQLPPQPPLAPLPQATRPRRRHALRITVAATAAIACAVAAVVTGNIAHAELTRQPRTSELDAAAALGLAQRWERVSAGTIFPARIGYSTNLFTQEAAIRVGIAPASSCAAAVDQTLTALAARYRCDAALRASYIDGLDGVVYTVGVLAFPTAADSRYFYRGLPPSGFPATGLHALALPGTAAARFDDAARQASVAQRTGPYVVLTVAGYADGRAASATGERRSSDFAPASQLAGAVTAPLSAPEVVNCKATSEWSC